MSDKVKHDVSAMMERLVSSEVLKRMAARDSDKHIVDTQAKVCEWVKQYNESYDCYVTGCKEQIVLDKDESYIFCPYCGGLITHD